MAYERAQILDNFELVGKVKSIFQYPVKSCGGFSLTEANCQATGIESNEVHDRQLFIVKNDNAMISSLNGGALINIHTKVENKSLILSKEGKSDCVLHLDDLARSGTITQFEFLTKELTCIDCGEDVGKWLDDALGEPLDTMRLLYHPESEDHRANSDLPSPWSKNGKDDDKIFLQHTNAIQLMGEASVADLNVRLSEKYDEPPYADMRQFRPNIVVEGSTAYAEDLWEEVFIGNSLHLYSQKHCDRCVVTTLDVKSGKSIVKGEPVKTLQSYRPHNVGFMIPGYGPWPGNAVLGINMNVKTPGAIKVGDPVYALINEDLYAKLGGIVGISD